MRLLMLGLVVISRHQHIFHKGSNVKNYVSIEENFYHIRLYISPLHPLPHMVNWNLKQMYVVGTHIDVIYILVTSCRPEIYILHEEDTFLLET